MERLSWLGIASTRPQTPTAARAYPASASRIACYVVPTDEELMIARHTLDCLTHSAQWTQEVKRMIDPITFNLLKGKKALVTGIANDQSIAWGCAKAFRALGATWR